MKPSSWQDFFHRAQALAEKFEKHLTSKKTPTESQYDRWDEELSYLRLGLISLIAPDGEEWEISASEFKEGKMRSAEIVLGSLERVHGRIVNIHFRARYG
ncbi:MAG: hypothetical protein QG633_560 [Patescibacteria group bacterium]|jgi:hypothetical protein|nr:hypothetical protein [Patescibacteria group bacterium]